MTDGTPAPGHADPAPASAEPGPRRGPLQIEYSSTRVVGGALARLQRTQGVVREDRSELAETFKMLRSQLFQRMRADGHTLLAVTSPRLVEGKSLTALNLALAIAAEHDHAVLLIDADLSGRGLQTLFGLEGQPGLSEHLRQGAPIAELLVNPGIERFVLLPAGAGGTLDSAELLGTRAAQQLIREMKERYRDRYVIVDLPPLLDTADALAFLPHADTTLMVVEEHTTSIADIESANELMAPFNLVGAVLTQARPLASPGEARRSGWRRFLGR
jgi:Mrp family chromosome partitioning ATPase